MTNWIKFVPINVRDGRKTKVWAVLTLDGTNNLGHVSWYPQWRKYAFYPNTVTVFEWDCLRKIANFCEEETRAYKTKRTAIHHINGNVFDNSKENLRIVNAKNFVPEKMS